MDFKGISFKGEFRNYQQRVLDNSERYLKDKKINIVAAPGSGKTVLGLELIRRLGNACIILSPTTTIRQQWGDRFSDMFLPTDSSIEDYVSFDLNSIKLINSITYQALYSAVNKVATSTEDEEIDYSGIELFDIIKERNIKTVCLDEAHHLQNEWQKALEKFIKGLDKEIVVISLTATPPYDASPSEWARYTSVCGEIDDEIFVPELVKEGTLCPHQDYIIFNYPTENEIESVKNQYKNCYLAIDEICNLHFFPSVSEKVVAICAADDERLYQSYDEISALSLMFHYAKLECGKQLYSKLTKSKIMPKLDRATAKKAVTFLLTSDLTDESQKQQIEQILRKYSLFERKKVNFDLTDRLKRELICSSGKLTSIKKIVRSESQSLGGKLRMLILTDFIKRESISAVGTDVALDNISIVSIFEAIRRDNPNAKVGCLSGSLIILPTTAAYQLADDGFPQDKIRCTEFNGTGFSSVTLRCQNRDKVNVISKLFEDGHINILVGTQALLGEGWDSPCINSLILASYVGSFMLSNQMRGRAIRTYKKDADKTANIWHLVTVEPDYLFEDNAIKSALAKAHEDTSTIHSCDFATMCRRFDCFVGPSYETGQVESGIDRITFLKPPFTKKNYEKINGQMFEKSKKRSELSAEWQNAIEKGACTSMQTDVPKQCAVPVFTYLNILALLAGVAVESIIISISVALINASASSTKNVWVILGCMAVSCVLWYFLRNIVTAVIKNRSTRQSMRSIGIAILRTLKDLSLVSDGATLKVYSGELDLDVSLEIKGASVHEQNVFYEAIKELLSPIENPRYLIIRKNIFGKYDFKNSFACPSVIAKAEDGVSILKRYFRVVGDVDIVYAYNEYGRRLMLNCKKYSFICKNQRELNKHFRVTEDD